MDEVDPELLKTFDKLGIPLEEQKVLSGMAVDAVMDSVSVKTTFKENLAEKGIIFCSFSEAVQHHPDLVQKYLGSVVSYRDNFFAALNSAVFSDGSFIYIPKGVRCPFVYLYPEGRALPHGAFNLFPHQCAEYGAVRADTYRGRRRILRLVPRRMHRADARREPAPCCYRRNHRPRPC